MQIVIQQTKNIHNHKVMMMAYFFFFFVKNYNQKRPWDSQVVVRCGACYVSSEGLKEFMKTFRMGNTVTLTNDASIATAGVFSHCGMW